MSQCGDIAGQADHADDFSIGVGDRGSDSVENTDGAVRPGIGFGKTKDPAGADGRFETGSKLVDVLEIQVSPIGFDRYGPSGNRDSKQTGGVFRANNLSGSDDIFPRSKFGVFFGVMEKALRSKAAGVGDALSGEVAKAQHEARRFVAEESAAVEFGSETILRTSGFDREFERSSLAGAEAAKMGRKKSGSGKTEESGKSLAEQPGAVAKTQGHIGTPDAYQLKSRIELKNRFFEAKDDGDEDGKGLRREGRGLAGRDSTGSARRRRKRRVRIESSEHSRGGGRTGGC